MKPTLEEIISYAESAAGTNYKKNRHSKNYNDTFNGIVKGAEWAISQMQPEWVPVTERLPEIGQQFLTYNFASRKVLIDELVIAISKPGWSKSYMPHVTHWMPLPQPPTN